MSNNKTASTVAADAIRTDGKRTGVPVAEPSILRSQAVLTLHSRQAQRLVFGRKAEPGRQPIFGLMRFAATARTLWNGAATDDPWADQWLLKIEEAIEAGNEVITKLQQDLDALLAALPQSITIQTAQAVEPYQIDLQFATPHAYQGTYLLAAYDQLICRLLTARHVALLNRQESQKIIDDAGRMIRNLFYVGQRYRFTGVTRKDVTEKNAKAIRAQEAMGELPELIISGELRPFLRPEVGANNTSDTKDAADNKPDLATKQNTQNQKNQKSGLDDLLSGGAFGPLTTPGKSSKQ